MNKLHKMDKTQGEPIGSILLLLRRLHMFVYNWCWCVLPARLQFSPQQKHAHKVGQTLSLSFYEHSLLFEVFVE